MPICRVLLENDISDMTKLWKNKDTVFKVPVDEEYFLNLEDRVFQSLAGKHKDRSTIYGIFEHGNLVATCGVYRWQGLPYYTVGELIIGKSERSPKIYIEFMNLFFQNIFPLMEAEERYQFFILNYLRPYQEKKLIDNKIWQIPEEITPFHRYNIYLETLIKANTQPAATYWDLMGKKKWAKNLWIRRGVLKDEYLIPNLMRKLTC